jgi:hypothetical protein
VGKMGLEVCLVGGAILHAYRNVALELERGPGSGGSCS